MGRQLAPFDFFAFGAGAGTASGGSFDIVSFVNEKSFCCVSPDGAGSLRLDMRPVQMPRSARAPFFSFSFQAERRCRPF